MGTTTNRSTSRRFGAQALSGRYVELHAHSNFSLLDGADHPETLVTKAAELGMPALALTDHDGVYGAIKFQAAARTEGIRPVLGAELTLHDNSHLTLLVQNEAGWHNLCYLISRARHNAPKGSAKLPPGELLGCTNGLIALSGCRHGAISQAVRRDDRATALKLARRYQQLFGPGNFYIELQRHFRPNEDRLINSLSAVADYLHIPCVATNNVHYAKQTQHRLQDILVCIANPPLTLDEAVHERRPNSEFYLKSAGEMTTLFANYPAALHNTLHIAERCDFELVYGLQDLPHHPTPHGMSSEAYLRRLCESALSDRCTGGEQTARQQLNHELAIIEAAGLANYFLIVADIVRYANEQGIRCQGRGSAANSLVAYLLRISPIDPLAHDLVFERFLSAERQVVPDIDIDFDAARREEVIQYIYDHYGAEHTAMACTLVTFRKRSALRDVGKALGLTPEIVAAATHALENGTTHLEADERAPVEMLLELCEEIKGFPRHLGIHSGGMIITGTPLMGRVPTEPATMQDRVVVQWDKDSLEEAGLVKIDLLGLRMLSALTEAVDLVEAETGNRPDLDHLTQDDPAIYNMISRADTRGVFQVESRAQTQTLPRLQPRTFNDLIVSISLIRPGPIQGNMVHPYLRRREGTEVVSYAHPLLEPVLEETLGVILFQEQVLKVASALASFSPGQGEQLRRALGAKHATARIEAFRGEFMAGALGNDVSEETATMVFDQLLGFGSYSFAKSHAAAFAVIVYQSAWLKHYHLPAFFAALLNNQPMGFWTPAVLVNEGRRLGMTIHNVSINESDLKCTLVGYGLRLGFNYVKRVGETAETIVAERENGRFHTLTDFCRRTKITRRLVENLIAAGAMDEWGIPRRQLLWDLGQLRYEEEELEFDYPLAEVELPALSTAGAMLMEQSVMGLSPGDHIMTLYRERLNEFGLPTAGDLLQLNNGQQVTIAGLLVVHQAPGTAKGHHFLTLEDENGLMDVVLRPKIYDKYRRLLQHARLLLVRGTFQKAGNVISILGSTLREL